MKQLLAMVAFALCAGAMDGESLSAVLDRIDSASHGFSGVRAQMKALTHTAILNDDTIETGVFEMQRRGKDVRALVDLTAETDKRVVFFAGKTVEIYLPNAQLLQVYDLGGQGKALDQYLLLGFGTPSKELEAGYQVRLAGQNETVDGKKAARLELEPKDPATREWLPKAEIWIPEDSGLPIQQKIYQKNGNYRLVTYSHLELATPSDKPLKLDVPPGTKTDHPH